MSVTPGKGKIQCGGCNLYYPPDIDYCGWCDAPIEVSVEETKPGEAVQAEGAEGAEEPVAPKRRKRRTRKKA